MLVLVGGEASVIQTGGLEELFNHTLNSYFIYLSIYLSTHLSAYPHISLYIPT